MTRMSTDPLPTDEQAAQAVADAAEDLQNAQDALERAVVAMRRTGASMAAIADAAGYSPPGIMSMLRRHGVR